MWMGNLGNWSMSSSATGRAWRATTVTSHYMQCLTLSKTLLRPRPSTTGVLCEEAKHRTYKRVADEFDCFRFCGTSQKTFESSFSSSNPKCRDAVVNLIPSRNRISKCIVLLVNPSPPKHRTSTPQNPAHDEDFCLFFLGTSLICRAGVPMLVLRILISADQAPYTEASSA